MTPDQPVVLVIVDSEGRRATLQARLEDVQVHLVQAFRDLSTTMDGLAAELREIVGRLEVPRLELPAFEPPAELRELLARLEASTASLELEPAPLTFTDPWPPSRPTWPSSSRPTTTRPHAVRRRGPWLLTT